MKFGVNPFMMGLLGGMGGFTQGYGQYLNQRRMGQMQMALANYKQQNAMSLEKLKGQNDMLIKSLQAEANQRTYTVNKIGPNGQPQTYTMRNALDPATHTFTPKQIGDPVPWRDPAANTAATNATRLQVAKMEIGAANARAQNRQANNASLQGQLNAREQVRETGLNKRAATQMTNQQMKEYDQMGDPSALLQNFGIDPSDPQARSKYRQAVLNQNMQTLGAGAAASGAAAGAPPEVRYDSQGNAYIKGADGKPVPYNPGADVSDGSQDGSVASAQDPSQLDPTQQDPSQISPGQIDPSQPNMSSLAMDEMVNSPEYQNAGDDGSMSDPSGPGLLGGDPTSDPTSDPSQDSSATDDQTGLMNGQYS